MAVIEGAAGIVAQGRPVFLIELDAPAAQNSDGTPMADICASLREAMEELEKDMDFLLAGDVFTRDQIEGYMDLKWEEIYAFEHTPHPVEFKMYYSC